VGAARRGSGRAQLHRSTFARRSEIIQGRLSFRIVFELKNGLRASDQKISTVIPLVT
jgi:hypothetical protein